jgi:hypothetical protein
MTNTTAEALAFLKREKSNPSRSWLGYCLMLQRMARDLPAVYPSALAAANATPVSERVAKVADLRQGMVAYSDDPHDSNPSGHIYFIAGWANGVTKSESNADRLFVFTNDAPKSGRVGVVPITYFRSYWGDSFQFGATWLNGYSFPDFDKAAEPVHPTLGANYQHALDDIRKAIAHHQKKGDERIVKALQRDLDRMTRKFAKYSD